MSGFSVLANPHLACFFPYPLMKRAVAQSGSAPAWGAGGRGFESRQPDSFDFLGNSRDFSVTTTQKFGSDGDSNRGPADAPS